VLSPSNRLTSPVHFREVVRRGRRSGGPLIVVHLLASLSEPALVGRPVAPRVGFVVSKAVGDAVTRNLVKRRLRHLARERTPLLPSRGMLVVRALPAAADASYDDLARELDRCLVKLGVGAPAGARVEVGG
jgi:ribonuclease P protein component